MTSRPVLVVLCGMPASGKSLLALSLAAEHGAAVLTADRIRTERASARHVMTWLHAECTRMLAEGRSVVTDTCALRPQERSRLRLIGLRAGARCELVIVNTPWRICAERNAQRPHPAKVVWLGAAALMRNALEAAHGECWDRVSVVNQVRKQ